MIGPLRPGAIPPELRARPQWVLWRAELRDGKTTKVPYCETGSRASSTDAATWTTFAKALAAHRRGGFDGVGYALSAADPYVALDLDHVLEDGVVSPWAQRIVAEIDSYTEISPSGTGLRIMVRATLPPGARRRGQLEAYDRARYVTMTGNHVAGTPATVEHRQAAVDALHARELARPERPQSTTPPRPVDLDDRELLIRAVRAANGDRFAALWEGDLSAYGGDRSAADLALCAHLAFWTGRDPNRVDRLFRLSSLMRDKWDERHYSTGETYGQRTVATAIASCINAYEARCAS